MKFNNIIIIIVLVIAIIIEVGWIKDINRLSNCDFKAPYKAEIICSAFLAWEISGIGYFLLLGNAKVEDFIFFLVLAANLVMAISLF